MDWLKRFQFRPMVWALALAVVSFVIGLAIERHAHQVPDPTTYAQRMELALHSAEAEIEDLFRNSSLLFNAVEGYILGDTVAKYINKPYTLLIYNDHDSVVYWNNNKVLPYQSDIRYSRQDTIERYEMNGSVFLKIHRPYDFLIDDSTYHYNLEALIPLYRHYSIQNNYLKDHFTLLPKAQSAFVELSETPTPYAVHDRQGEPIVYLKASVDYPYHWYVIFSTLCYFLSAFLVLLAVYFTARHLSRNKGYVLGGLLFFVGCLFLFRLLTILYNFPVFHDQYAIFREQLSAAHQWWLYSLGDFLVDSGLVFWLALYVARTIHVRDIQHYNHWQQWSLGAVGYTALMGGLAVVQSTINDIVRNSFISFEFDDFSNLDWYSLLSLLGMGLFLLSYFFLSYRFMRLIQHFRWSAQRHAILIGIAWVVTMALSFFTAMDIWDRLMMTIGTLVNALVLQAFVNRNTISLAWVSIWLMLFSAYTTSILEKANNDKGVALREQYAHKLASERDFPMEKVFGERIAHQILDDGSLKISISNPLSPSPRRQAIRLLTYRYLDNYFFGRYDYKVHLYTEQGRPFRGESRPYASFLDMWQHSKQTDSPYLNFYSVPDGQYRYIAKLPLTQNNVILGVVFIEFTPRKDFKKSNIYVELLSRNKDRLESIYSQYPYALYKHKERVTTNNPNFKAELPHNLPIPQPGKYTTTQLPLAGDNYYYIIYRDQDQPQNIALVAMFKLELFEAFTVFAYIFSFGIFLLLALQLVNWMIKRLFNKPFIEFQFENSLGEQIQRGIILVTLASFVAIAIITILYYSNEYDDYHRARLLRKISSTARTAVWQIREGDKTSVSLPEASSLADIHKIDVNIYALDGSLLSSSEKVVFERHLLSRKMNAIAFQRLRNEQQNLVSQEEIINNFEYLSAYVPLKDKQDVTIAYLNLPYDLAGSNNIGSQDVAEFLGALLNVYVIFLLIAGGAAFFIANSVTNPLSVIGAKLDEVELGKKNEPLIWNNNDEIGELVDRYNHMIQELEESTKKLARSQRESAWREMAKQIAHEIKNPLTPMKLNIQLLERVVNSDPERAQRMVDRVCKTLIEQIDSLAHIASEFSTFAKMPVANKEYLHVNELVQNAYNLFKEEKVQLTLDMTEKTCVVYADKTQIIRVLNNLLKNALQAIPDDKEGQVAVKLANIQQTVIIKVSDNGCGIPQEQAEDIFVPNFTTKSSGTGIGLAMSKTIVEMANGQIYFVSEVDKGTDFYVELPAANPTHLA